jgi:kynurenine formamidase
LERDGWNYGAWSLSEHVGTHFDAPSHRSNGPAAHEVPPAKLVGPLIVLSLTARASANPDATLGLREVRDWEQARGPIPDGAVIAMHSGWEARLRTPSFRNADANGVLHFPGFAPDAVEFLLRERDVIGLAVDTLSLDPGCALGFPVHSLWLGAGRWGLECVANLRAVPPVGATIVVGAPKVVGASGGPARVLALW